MMNCFVLLFGCQRLARHGCGVLICAKRRRHDQSGNSPGTLNINGGIDWLGGGNYNWQIVGLTGTAGTVSTWDLNSATGILDLTAFTTRSEFNINLWSLSSTSPDVSGNLTGFNNTQN
jgi:hypothetical protein